MNSSDQWFLVDDQPDEAAAFAAKLSSSGSVQVIHLRPSDARIKLLTGKYSCSGVLMDVDLSSDPGEHGTGLGLAQDLRAAQKSGTLLECPIIRFSWRERVANKVGGDPTSDDLFDLKIDKNELGLANEATMSSLLSVASIYKALESDSECNENSLANLLGLNEEQAEVWLHPGLFSRIIDGRQVAVHVAAGATIRCLLDPPGLLIGENLLSVRLGLDLARSGRSWLEVKSALTSIEYGGIAHTGFQRWWHYGLDDWWLSISGKSDPLASFSIAERVEVLRVQLSLPHLEPLVMPKGSAGDRPWSFCALSLEAEPKTWVPIDPTMAVRITPRIDVPPWLDDTYASLGMALRTRDARLDRQNIKYLHGGFR